MAFGKMDYVRECHHLPQKIRARAKTLEDAGDVCSAGFIAPFLIDLRDEAGGFGILDLLDLCGSGSWRWGLRFSLRLQPGVLVVHFHLDE